MKIISGCIYFIADKFFEKIDDPYLKINYEFTKRPHYLALQDIATSLYWLVPCSSKVEKFEHIIKQKQLNHKPTNGIKILIIRSRKTVLLFQDMFPIDEKYIEKQYIRDNEPVMIADTKIVAELERNAKKIITLLRRGIKFTPTAPNIKHIEKLMLEEIIKE
ncbi:MAG: hypothetical protein LBI78_02160 [Campylobacteraceae bacterium]|jgi:hypothetical protein|nr:hypothetical protein [Campylobacteraceae bacterium]